MFVSEFAELREMIKDEDDKKTKALLIALLCIADKVSENTVCISNLQQNRRSTDMFVNKVDYIIKFFSWLSIVLPIIVIAVFGYIFSSINTMSIKQAIVIDNLNNIKYRNEKADAIQEELLKIHEKYMKND